MVNIVIDFRWLTVFVIIFSFSMVIVQDKTWNELRNNRLQYGKQGNPLKKEVENESI